MFSRIRRAGGGGALCATLCLCAACRRAPATPISALTYHADVAPLLAERCGRCHRPGQPAPFSVFDYQAVRPRAERIAAMTAQRRMPPWLPAPGYGEFENERRLSQDEVERIGRWVSQGALEGDPPAAASAPAPVGDWQLGTPDLVVQLADLYWLQPGTADEFRNFVIPIPTSTTRYVRGIELRPGSDHVVHHATLGIDRTRSSQLLDAGDPAPGYEGMFAEGARSPENHAVGWTPGMMPWLDRPGMAWRLEAGSDLVVQLHMMPSHLSQPAPVRPAIGFYFSDVEPTFEPIDFKLGSKAIDIPAGASDYVAEDTYVLPVDVDVLSVYPHAHFLAREMQAFAHLPDGTVRWLLWIKNWDFKWQDQYRYKRPLFLPAGTALTMRFVYDNSAESPNNPSRPPRRVKYGPNSSDEMGDLWLRLLPRRREDVIVLARAFVANELRKDIDVAERELAAHPGDGRWLGIVGVRYLEAGRIVEGRAHLQRAVERSPKDASIRSNLGAALRAEGRLAEAVAELSRAVALAPGDEQIRLNLAEALQDLGDLPAAVRHLRAALRLNPSRAESHNNLGVALASRGEIGAAVAAFRQALDIRPDYPDARDNLALALAAQGGARGDEQHHR